MCVMCLTIYFLLFCAYQWNDIIIDIWWPTQYSINAMQCNTMQYIITVMPMIPVLCVNTLLCTIHIMTNNTICLQYSYNDYSVSANAMQSI